VTTKERLVTSLCRLVTRLLPITIARFAKAHETSALLPGTVQEIRQVAAECEAEARPTPPSLKGAAETAVPLPSASVSVFGDDALDLLPISTTSMELPGSGDSGQSGDGSSGPSSSASSSLPSFSFSGVLAGLGVHLEAAGVSLRTTQPLSSTSGSGSGTSTSTSSALDAPPAETALEECHRLVAAGLLVARAAQRCLLWKCDGLAGCAAQVSYLSMLQCLAELVTPVGLGDAQNLHFIDQQRGQAVSRRGLPSSAEPPTTASLLHASVLWARGAYTDLVHALLSLLAAPLTAPLAQNQHQHQTREPPGDGPGTGGWQGAGAAVVTVSHGILLPFVTFVSQYLQALFGNTESKPKQKKVRVRPSFIVIVARDV
jgi:hypothetical protein